MQDTVPVASGAVSETTGPTENGGTTVPVPGMDVDSTAGTGSAVGGQHGIDEEEAALYDRQLRLWGLEAQNRMRNGSVLMINLRGIATEACKNIVLAGTGSVTILDDQDVVEEDLGSGFFLREEEVGMKRVLAAKERINALNPRVAIIAETDMSKLEDDDFLSQFSMVCLTDASSVMIARINERCRKLRKPFYAATSMGLHGYIFTDLLEHEYIIDREIPQSSGETRKVPTKKTQSFVPFTDALQSSWKHLSPKKMKKVSRMMWACLAIFEYQRLNDGKTPDEGALAPEVIKLAAPALEKLSVTPSLLSAELVESVCEMGTAEFIPTCAIVGAILSQDILNALGGRESPVTNFFVWDGDIGSGMIYPLGVTRT